MSCQHYLSRQDRALREIESLREAGEGMAELIAHEHAELEGCSCDDEVGELCGYAATLAEWRKVIGG